MWLNLQQTKKIVWYDRIWHGIKEGRCKATAGVHISESNQNTAFLYVIYYLLFFWNNYGKLITTENTVISPNFLV